MLHALLLPLSWRRNFNLPVPYLHVPVKCLTRVLVLAANSCAGQGQQLKDGAPLFCLVRFQAAAATCVCTYRYDRVPGWLRCSCPTAYLSAV